MNCTADSFICDMCALCIMYINVFFYLYAANSMNEKSTNWLKKKKTDEEERIPIVSCRFFLLYQAVSSILFSTFTFVCHVCKPFCQFSIPLFNKIDIQHLHAKRHDFSSGSIE